MKCPKCHYLSFEPEPRCRNCGFSFSLSEVGDVMIPSVAAAPAADLTLRPSESEAPDIGRLRLREDASELRPAPPSREERGATSLAAGVTARPEPTTELPLFVKALSASEPEPGPSFDGPLVQAPASPMPPLAVRRRSEGAVRPRPTPTPAELKKLGPFDRDLLADLQRLEQPEPTTAPDVPPVAPRRPHVTARVGAGARAAAAAVDATVLGATASGVLWVTLRWCELPVERASVLPVIPTSAFLLLVGAGYLLMFTALGGQTLGKMLFGIRVVGATDRHDAPLTLRQAVYRSLLTLPSVLVLGLGFVPALLGDELALHDRLTRTRVVRA